MCENTYVNVQTGEVLDLNQLEDIKSNALLKHSTHLFNEWDFEKNDELGLDIYKVTKGSDKKAWWICSKCKSKFYRKIEIRSRGQNCPYCVGRMVNHTNSLASLRPELASEWHPAKNGDLTPHDVTCSKGTKVWWVCLKCSSDYEQSIDKKTQGRGCPYCAGYKINSTNSLADNRKDLMVEWHIDKNKGLNPYEIGCGSGHKVWWICKDNRNHEWITSVNNRNNGTNCPYCTHNPKLLIGENDLWTTHPEIASKLLNQEEGYKHTEGSNIKVKWVCEDCNHINKNTITELKNKIKAKCNRCSDKLSFGEKILYEVLLSKNIDFEYNKKLIWSQNKRYDFHFIYNEKSYIVEVNGIQHYDRGFEAVGGRTLEEEQENDKLKEQLAKENGIDHYIVIDARYSDMDWIKTSILDSFLCKYLDLKDEDILNIDFNYSSITVSIWDLWNNGLRTMEIVDKLKVSKRMVRNKLLLGQSIGKCTYNKANNFKNTNKRIS